LRASRRCASASRRRKCGHRSRHRPAIDGLESFLAGVFLRRCVTYCARCGRYAQMSGSAAARDAALVAADAGANTSPRRARPLRHSVRLQSANCSRSPSRSIAVIHSQLAGFFGTRRRRISCTSPPALGLRLMTTML